MITTLLDSWSYSYDLCMKLESNDTLGGDNAIVTDDDEFIPESDGDFNVFWEGEV